MEGKKPLMLLLRQEQPRSEKLTWRLIRSGRFRMDEASTPEWTIAGVLAAWAPLIPLSRGRMFELGTPYVLGPVCGRSTCRSSSKTATNPAL
jgi:hypothetical protein